MFQADIGGPVVINTAPAGWIPVWTQVGINSYTQGNFLKFKAI
jgi:hypothetical protein